MALGTHSVTLWACLCCMLNHANGECGCDGNGGCAGKPWSLIEPGQQVTMGLLAEEHADDCTEEIRRDDGCDCARREFSSSSCDGCGSYLAGERHAFTVWFD